MTEPPGSSPADRRARREFIRTHHPDAGGDQHTFIAGLADLDAGGNPPATSTPGPTPTAETEPPAWPVSLTTVLLHRLRRLRRVRQNRRQNRQHGPSAT